ncbi:class I SAM-dependent methyltransferase [Acidiphilium sp. MT5]
MEQRVAAVESQLQEETESRAKRVDDTLRFLLDRVEFVRRELMFEIRYNGSIGAPTTVRPKALQPHVLEPDKVAAARAAGLLRVNLGCGHIMAVDYINVDMRDLPGVDVVADVSNLPFEPGTIDEIASSHLIEHFPQEELRRRLLPYWYSLLKPGGTLRAVMPDGAAMLSGIADGSYSFSDFREVLFGGQDYEGDFHFNLLTPDSFRQLVEEAGFEAVEIPVQARRNGRCFEFELVAMVPVR